MPYVGFNNYEAVFNDTKFWTSVWLTIKYVAASVFLINTVAFLLAYLVTMGIRGQNFFELLFLAKPYWRTRTRIHLAVYV